MSRKGKMPIPLPKGVEVTINGRSVSVKGAKGALVQELGEMIEIKIADGNVLVGLKKGFEKFSNQHGLARALLENMIVGVSKGFEKKLNLIGVGFRAAVKGKAVDFQLGLSHPLALPIPEGLQVKIDQSTEMTISGADKQLVGQFAADVRSLKAPEPYKGKGIHYQGEYVRRKAGKAAAAAKTAAK